MSIAEAIKQEARRLGFDAVGIASVPASPDPSGLLERLHTWLARRYHGTMDWMARDPARRADPEKVLPGCRSLICVGMNYDTGQRPVERPGYGRIARYAWGKDYHDVLDKRLRRLEATIHELAPEADTRSYVDTGPIMEKAWAERAGLGWIGKHSNLVSAEHGSWLVLGEILCTLELAGDEPATDLCGRCSLCVDACPTKAIVEPYVVDATRCISYLTIEFRGISEDIPADLSSRMGNHIFGCDDCLDVCPFNLRAEPTREPAFFPSSFTLAPDLDSVAELDDSTFVEQFHESPIRRTKLRGLLRNAAIAKANQSVATFRHPKVHP